MKASLSPKFQNASTPKPQKKKYPPPLSLRLTHQERERLEVDAGDLTLSAYIRLCLFGDSVPKHRTRGKKVIKDHEAIALILAQLGRSNIANNLNQLAKAANAGTLPPSSEAAAYLKEARDHVIAIRVELIKALGLAEAPVRRQDSTP